jgi:tetratricopeptide (TPR) repeat protein
VQSLIDWTWFVPGPAVMALAAAGLVAGSGRPEAGFVPRALRPVPWPRIGIAAAALVAVGICAWAAYQPQRSHAQAERAYELLADGQIDAGDRAAKRAEEINTLALEPIFARAAVFEQRGDLKGAEAQLRRGVREHPADPASWLRLAQFQLFTLDEPKRAQETVRGALALDPNSREAAYAYFESRVRLRGGDAAAGGGANAPASQPTQP